MSQGKNDSSIAPLKGSPKPIRQEKTNLTKSTFFGSALALLLAFSVISYSKTFIQQQAPKPAKIQQPIVFEVVGQTPEVVESTLRAEDPAGISPADLVGGRNATF